MHTHVHTCWLTPSAGLIRSSPGALGPWVPCPGSSLASGHFDLWPPCPALPSLSPPQEGCAVPPLPRASCAMQYFLQLFLAVGWLPRSRSPPELRPEECRALSLGPSPQCLIMHWPVVWILAQLLWVSPGPLGHHWIPRGFCSVPGCGWHRPPSEDRPESRGNPAPSGQESLFSRRRRSREI